MKLCFDIDGKCICVPILEQYVPTWLPDPPEVRWIESELINPQTVHELQSLATLQAIGNRLGGELGTKVHSLVEVQVSQLKLPKEFKVELTPNS